MRRLLKNFPDKGSNLIDKEDVVKEIQDIKQTIQLTEAKSEVVSLFDNVAPKEDSGVISETQLLGELLSNLRKNKQMSVLMICRQISKIEIIDGIAIIHQSGQDEISVSDQACAELKKFFDSKGLGYRVYKKEKGRDPIQELNEMLGGKLKVE